MIYNATQWGSIYDKGHMRYCLFITKASTIVRYNNKWSVRLGRYGGSKKAGWVQIMNNIDYNMLMVF